MLTNRQLLEYLQSVPSWQLDCDVAIYSVKDDCFYKGTGVERAGVNCAEMYRAVKEQDTVIYLELK